MTEETAPRTRESLMRDLQQRNIRLWIKGDELRYRAPPGGLTADLAAEIRSRKSEIIASLAHGLDAVAHAAPATVRANVSSLQQHMLAYYEQLQFPRFLHLCKVVPFKRALNIELLGQSVRHVVQRHAIVRTRFTQQDSDWIATVHEEVRLDVEEIDLTRHPAADRHDRAKEIFAQLSGRRFDVRNGPLLRVAALRLDGDSWLLALIFHHAIADGWSLAVAFREIAVGYACLERGRQIALPALPIQFHDYVERQRQWLEGPAGKQQLTFWRQLFAGVREPFRLPADPQQAPAASREPVAHEFTAPCTEALRQWAREEQTTLFIVMLTAFCLELARWRGNPEVCLWALHHGRSRPELQGLIGCCFDTLGLRIDLSDAADFRGALRAVHDHYLQVLPNRDVPSQSVAAIIYEQVGLLERATLFNYVSQVTSNSPEPAATTIANDGEAAVLAHALEHVTPNGYLETENGTQLMITVFERNDCVRCMLQYDPHVFQDATLEALSEAVFRMLQRVASGADVPLR